MSFRKTNDFVPKIILFLGFSALASLSRAEFLAVTVTGIVTDAEDMPVGNVDVFISTIFEDSTFYYITATSDEEGYYIETIPVPDWQSEGTVSISSIGCNGEFAYFIRSWSLTESVITQDFMWCNEMEFGDSCVVLILPNPDPLTGIITLYAVSSGQEPIDYLWSDQRAVCCNADHH